MLQRVLVADDSEPVQKAIQIALEPYSVEIFEASSFVEALNICKKKSPNLIIADASLTGTDAPKEFKTMSNTAGEVPVLLLEGSFEPIDKEGFEAIGLNCFLKKPFNISEIEQVIKEQMHISLPVKGQEGKTQEEPIPKKMDRVPPPPPPPPIASRPPSTSWESQLVESDLQLDLSMTDEFDDDSIATGPEEELPMNEEASEPDTEDFSVSEKSLEEALMEPEPATLPDSEPLVEMQPDEVLPTEEPQDIELPEDKLPEEEPQGEGPLDDHDHDDKGQPSSDLIESLIPALQQEILPLLKDEVEEQVKKAITEYCERHFKRLAREVIKEELRALVAD